MGIILPHNQKKTPFAFDSYEAHLADVIKRHKKAVEKIMDVEAIDQAEANHYALQKTVFNLQVQFEQMTNVITLMQEKLRR